MKRTLARLGLLGLLVGTPFALGFLVGSPTIPNFSGSDGLSGTYLPVGGVLRLVGLLAWALWAYLAFAVLLNTLAVVAAATGMSAQHGLYTVSALLTPRVVRRMVDLAVGSTLLAATVSGRIDLPGPMNEPVAAHASVDGRAGVRVGPAVLTKTPKAAPYRVRAGDSLWRIAELKLGSGFRWREIFELNRGRQFPDGRCLTNPHLIYPGWVLELPRESEAPPAPHGNGRAGASGGPHPTPPPGSHTGPPVTEGKVTPSPSAAPDTRQEVSDVEDPELEPLREPAVRLPSGLVVATSFASGLLTAYLLARLRQRRSRRLSDVEMAEPVEAPLADDLRRAGASPMAGPLDVALQAVTHAWRERNRVWPQVLLAAEGQQHVSVLLGDSGGALPPTSGGNIAPLVRFTRAGGIVRADVDGPFPPLLRQATGPFERGLLVPLGRAPDGSVVHVGLMAAAEISVVGTEAGRLVSQMVVAAAIQATPEDVQLLLLGMPQEFRVLEQLPQVVAAHAWEQASVPLREVQVEFVRRARLFFEEGVEDVWSHHAEHPEERLPALLVVASEPPAALRGAVEAVARQARGLGAGLIALGWKPEGVGLIADAGSVLALETDLPCPEQLEPLLLDQDTAEQAVEVLRRAHPKPEDAAPETDGGEALVTDESPAPAEPIPHPAPAESAQIEPESGRSTEPEPGPLPPTGLLAVRCLGSFEVCRDGRVLRKGWRNKARELLAYLVAHPAGAPRDRVVEELWPGIEPGRGSELFARMTWAVRAKVRGPDDTRRYVDKEDELFYLEKALWWADVWEFERLVDEAQRSEQDEAIGKLRDVVALYRGEFCADFYYPWAEPVRERFRALFVRACARLADLLLGRSAHEEALALLDRGIEADPVCEDLSRRAMAIEASLGRRAAALARYRKLEIILDQELGVEPDPETQAIARQLALSRHGAEATG